MRALNVQQPWASLIVSGRKTHEVRSWTTRYRGPVVIVASLKKSSLASARAHLAMQSEWPAGVTVCVAELVDVIEGHTSHMDMTGGIDPTGSWCWVFRCSREIPHMKVKGKLGLWHYPSANSLRASRSGILSPLHS